MTLDRKEFIRTTSFAFVGLAQGRVKVDCGSYFLSKRYENIPIQGSIEDKLRYLKLSGINVVDLNSVGYEREKMLLALEKTGLRVGTVYHADNWTKSLSASNEEKRKSAVNSVFSSLEFAESLDAEFVQVLPGLADLGLPEESKKSLLISLQEISAKLKKFRVKILLQNFYGKNFNQIQFWKSVFKSIDAENFGFCLDTSKTGSGFNLKKWLSELKQYLFKLDLDKEEIGRVNQLVLEHHSIHSVCVDEDVSAKMCHSSSQPDSTFI